MELPTVQARELAAADLPEAPGVYLWSRSGEPVYLGMAKSLRGAPGANISGGAEPRRFVASPECLRAPVRDFAERDQQPEPEEGDRRSGGGDLRVAAQLRVVVERVRHRRRGRRPRASTAARIHAPTQPNSANLGLAPYQYPRCRRCFSADFRVRTRVTTFSPLPLTRVVTPTSFQVA